MRISLSFRFRYSPLSLTTILALFIEDMFPVTLLSFF